MAGTLVELIEKNMELLVDGITKEAIQRIPSYGEAPIKQTLGRMERMLGVLVDSIRRNHPDRRRTGVVRPSGINVIFRLISRIP